MRAKISWTYFGFVFSLAVLASFFVFRPVLAQEPTVTLTPSRTPTPSFTPIVPASTPTSGAPFGIVTEPYSQSNCPVGNPDGWLTITPDALWEVTCGHCITPTPTVTNPVLADVFATSAAYAGDVYSGVVGTPTHYPTSLPGSTAAPVVSGATAIPTLAGTAELNFSSTPYWTYNGNNGTSLIADGTMTCIQLSVHAIQCDGSNMVSDDVDGLNVETDFYIPVIDSNWPRNYYISYSVEQVGGCTGCGQFVSVSDWFSDTLPFSHQFSVLNSGDNGLAFRFYHTSLGYAITHSVIFSIVISNNAYTAPIPLVTPSAPTTDDFGNYCSSVVSDTGLYSSLYDLPDLFTIASIGTCLNLREEAATYMFAYLGSIRWDEDPLIPSLYDYFRWAWYDLNQAALFWLLALVPNQGVCFYEVDFETVNLLGVVVSLAVFPTTIVSGWIFARLFSK